MNANDAVWLTIVTMTSVGYGRSRQRRSARKLAISLGAIAGGTILLCLLRVVLINALLISPQETLVLDVVRFHEYMRQRKQLAAVLVQRSVRLWRLRRSDAPQERSSARVSVSTRLLKPFACCGSHSRRPRETPTAQRSGLLSGTSGNVCSDDVAVVGDSLETLNTTSRAQELMLLRVHEVSQVMKDVALSTT
ncbi:hypothetical protein PINS_up022651 [Pythium insidiosum]|nr:hypothetical protein PINS_up022651 [Pythium insidiosum]